MRAVSRHQSTVSFPRRLVRTLRRLHRLNWPDRLLVLEALLCLGRVRLLLLIVPFKRIAPRLGPKMVETGPEIDPSIGFEAQKIGWIVRRLAPITPWESKCLVQAMTARQMLLRRGIPSTLYLGVAWDADNRRVLTAHAWLRCGPHFLTGGAGHQSHKVICTFGLAEKLSGHAL